MSILLVGLDLELTEALAARLQSQGDEVRVLGPPAGFSAPSGIYVAATGDLDDADLIERAAQNVRTVVVGESPQATEAMTAITAGASAAAVERLILVTRRKDVTAEHLLGGWTGEHAILRSASGGLLKRRSLPTAVIAEAVDAADDMAGEVRLDIDLNDPDRRAILRLASD